MRIFPVGRKGPRQTLRLTDSAFPLIKPLLACNIDAQEPTAAYSDLQSSLTQAIDERVAAGDVLSAGVYVRDLENGDWTAVNKDEHFVPGSLMKIITLMVYLIEADADPNILNETLTVHPTESSTVQNIPPKKTAEVDLSYTVKDLLELMIVYSDNAANRTLVEHLNTETYNQLLSALEIPEYSEDETLAYTITPRLYSRLLRILYNSTLLSQPSSEFALELLARSDYRDGLVAGIDPATPVAHKFGEVGTRNIDGTVMHQHHDCGIVYAKNPYIICVMTKGNDLNVLAETIASLARITDAFMQKQ